jgi:[ribosomal protein S5]-alanine N-acetyltransferase
MHNFSHTVLKTARLDLRPLRPGDESALFRIHADPDFMRYWSDAPWADIERARRMIANDQRELAAGEHLRLGIVLRDSAQLIGTSSLFKLDMQNRRAEIGYGIAPAHWRQGYMSEAVSALIQFAFGKLDLIRLEADIDPRNLASAKSLEKLGFVREGCLRQRWIVAGEVSDSALYGLLAQEFSPATSSAK